MQTIGILPATSKCACWQEVLARRHAALRPVTVRGIRADWGPLDLSWIPEIDRVPILHSGSGVENMDIESLIVTNGDTAEALSLPSIHLWAPFLMNRQLDLSNFSTAEDTPEGKLVQKQDQYDGLLVPYLVGYLDRQSIRTSLGSLFCLSPPIAGERLGASYISFATAKHNIEVGLQHDFCSLVNAVEYAKEIPFNGLASDWCVGEAVDVLGPDTYKRVQPFERERCDPPPPQAATVAYPALEPADSGTTVRSTPFPDFLITRLSLQHDELGDVFPFSLRHGWEARLGYDFLVPDHSAAVGDYLALTGMPGTRLQEVQESRVPNSQMRKDIGTLTVRQAMASPGDIVSVTEKFICHRAPATYGCCGAALRRLDRPQALYGIHTTGGGSATTRGIFAPHNIGVSVNHPLFVAWYVKLVLPDLAQLPEDKWRTDYMRPTLAAWLHHHAALLQTHDLWDQHAAGFVSMHL